MGSSAAASTPATAQPSAARKVKVMRSHCRETKNGAAAPTKRLAKHTHQTRRASKKGDSTYHHACTLPRKTQTTHLNSHRTIPASLRQATDAPTGLQQCSSLEHELQPLDYQGKPLEGEGATADSCSRKASKKLRREPHSSSRESTLMRREGRRPSSITSESQTCGSLYYADHLYGLPGIHIQLYLL